MVGPAGIVQAVDLSPRGHERSNGSCYGKLDNDKNGTEIIL